MIRSIDDNVDRAMRDGDHRLALHHLRERVLDRGLDPHCLERRCRLVQHQHRRVLQERTGQRDAAAAARPESFTPRFAQIGTIAGAPRGDPAALDEAMRLGAAGGGRGPLPR